MGNQRRSRHFQGFKRPLKIRINFKIIHRFRKFFDEHPKIRKTEFNRKSSRERIKLKKPIQISRIHREEQKIQKRILIAKIQKLKTLI